MTGLEIARMRPVIESEIDRLIGILDMLEPDPDFEDGADLEEDNADMEPLLGAPERSAGSWNGIDASFACDDGEELELGWTELEARFGRYQAAGSDVYEPSLGSTNSVNQSHWSKGRSNDLEEQCDDEGAIDWSRERNEDGFTNPGQFCSPISTMLTQPASDAATQPGL